MEIDPIVLMAYVSVSINIITMIAACIAYAVFHVRKRRRRKPGSAAPGASDAAVTPVFLRRYSLASAIAEEVPPAKPMPAALAETPVPKLAGIQ
jgi:uncharacterized SAM-binding protein YcdF (DUF218 family)